MLVDNLKESIARRVAEGEAKGKARRSQGRSQGKVETQKTIARRMHGLGVSVAEIARMIGLPDDEVKRLLES